MKRFAFALILLTGCIDPYTSPEIEQGNAALVIEGMINVQGESTIKLSRTQNITDTGAPQPETGATIWIESETGTTTYLSESIVGHYVLSSQSFSAGNYRLHVKTSNLKEYVSTYELLKLSPAIDSVTWDLTDDLGVAIFVSTHDAETKDGYYRWTFDETWQYTSAYGSTYIYNYQTNSVDLRQEDVETCWRNDQSTNILIESTTRLSKNSVSKFPIKRISQNSERLRYKYSILVKQHAITKEAFGYWQQLKKTTEELGTLFGPLPTQVTGNFTSVNNPDEPVIGYFSIGSFSTKRIFIGFQELITPPQYDTPYQGCESYSLYLVDVPTFSGPYLLTWGIPNPSGPGILGYYYSSPDCVDCRLTGGTTTKPDFWQ